MYNRNYDPWTLASNIVEHRQVLYLGPVYSSTPEEFQHPASFLWLDLPSTLFRRKMELFALETKRIWIHLIYILNVDREQSETIFFWNDGVAYIDFLTCLCGEPFFSLAVIAQWEFPALAFTACIEKQKNKQTKQNKTKASRERSLHLH